MHLWRIILAGCDRRNRITDQHVLEEIKPYWNKTLQTFIMKNEALSQAQIGQKVV